MHVNYVRLDSMVSSLIVDYLVKHVQRLKDANGKIIVTAGRKAMLAKDTQRLIVGVHCSDIYLDRDERTPVKVAAFSTVRQNEVDNPGYYIFLMMPNTC
jgi:hypothetical protein